WHVCVPVNRKPVSSRAGQHPRRLYLRRAPVLPLFCKIEDGRQDVNSSQLIQEVEIMDVIELMPDVAADRHEIFVSPDRASQRGRLCDYARGARSTILVVARR
ncbi:hypothetical protein, partial [Paraburkholderia xenovorans]